MNFFPQVAKNTLAQILGRAGVVLISLLTTAILTRLLGLGGYGQYVFIISLILFFVAIADWGTSLIFVREAAKQKDKEEKFYGNALLFRLFLAVLSLILVNLLVWFLPGLQNLSLSIKIASLLLLLLSLKTSCHIVFQTRLKFEYIALTDLVVSLAFLVLLLFLFSGLGFAPNLALVMLVFVIANLLGTIAAIFWARILAQFDFRLNQEMMRKIFLEAMPTGALLLIFSIYNRLDIFLLQILRGPESVGVYGLAYKIHDNLILGAAYLSAALFPIISSMAGNLNAKKNLQTIYGKIFDLLLVCGLAVSVIVFILAPFIISLVGGLAFTESILVLRILVFATLLAYFNHLTGYTLIALGKQRVSLLVAVGALVWNLSLNLVLIPRYSYLAAAIVTIATEGLVFVLTSFYLSWRFSLRPSLTPSKTLIELVKTRGKIF